MPFDPYFSSAPDPQREEHFRKVALAKAFQVKMRLSGFRTSKKKKSKALKHMAETPGEYMDRIDYGMLHHPRRAHRQKIMHGNNPTRSRCGFPQPRRIWD